MKIATLFVNATIQKILSDQDQEYIHFSDEKLFLDAVKKETISHCIINSPVPDITALQPLLQNLEEISYEEKDILLILENDPTDLLLSFPSPFQKQFSHLDIQIVSLKSLQTYETRN